MNNTNVEYLGSHHSHVVEHEARARPRIKKPVLLAWKLGRFANNNLQRPVSSDKSCNPGCVNVVVYLTLVPLEVGSDELLDIILL
jgi:hypothetical protein